MIKKSRRDHIYCYNKHNMTYKNGMTSQIFFFISAIPIRVFAFWLI